MHSEMYYWFIATLIVIGIVGILVVCVIIPTLYPTLSFYCFLILAALFLVAVLGAMVYGVKESITPKQETVQVENP